MERHVRGIPALRKVALSLGFLDSVPKRFLDQVEPASNTLLNVRIVIADFGGDVGQQTTNKLVRFKLFVGRSKKRFDPVEGAALIQHRGDPHADHAGSIMVDDLEKQAFFADKAIVQAARLQTGRRFQIEHRRCLIALCPKDAHGCVEDLFFAESDSARHKFSLSEHLHNSHF